VRLYGVCSVGCVGCDCMWCVLLDVLGVTMVCVLLDVLDVTLVCVLLDVLGVTVCGVYCWMCWV